MRLRANEVVDDRVLLARAQAEIKRLKRRLREALEGTLLGAAEDHDGGGHADEANGGGGHHQAEGGRDSDGTAKIETGALGACIGESGEEGTKGGGRGADNMEITTAATSGGGQSGCVPTKEGEERTERISAANTPTPAVDVAQKRQTAKLIAENERLREDNDRLRADVQRLVLQSNKQRLRRQRRQQRGVGRAGNIPTGPPSAPIDWSTRYADAAADARRRRPESSHRAGSHARVNRSASSSRVVAMARRRRASPTTAPARVSSLPKFCRRQFGVDGNVEEGAESEGNPVEDGLSAEEVRAIIEGNDEAEATKTTLGLPRNQEEGDEEAVAAKQLKMFRRELQSWTGKGSFVRRGDDGGEEGAGGTPENSGTVDRTDGGASSGNLDEETDIELFLAKSQRLEDLMFEAQGREKRCLREERARLASSREQRLALEAQLAELTGGAGIADSTATGTHTPAHVSTVKSAMVTNIKHVPQLRVIPTAPSTSAEEGRGQPTSPSVWNHQPQQKQQQSPPPCFDGAVSAPDENRTTTTPSPILGVAGRGKTDSSHNHNRNSDREKRIGWAEQPSAGTADATNPAATTSTPTTTIPATTAATTAMMMAVLAPPEQSGGSSSGAPGPDRRGSHASNNPALGARRTVPATRLPQDRQRHKPGRVFPDATPVSLPYSSPSPGSRQRRPATSTGGPPTGNRARSRSRARGTQLRAGRVSRSPVRGGRLAFLEPSSPQCARKGGGRGGDEQVPQRGLAYGVADLGLRLKVIAATTDDSARVRLQGASQELNGDDGCCLIKAQHCFVGRCF